MSQFYRYGHCDKLLVKLGDKIKKGQRIGTVGTGNGQWSAHLHFDCPKVRLSSWTAYVFGWTLKEVKDIYANPGQYRKTVFPEFDHFGWLWLDNATYGSKKCFHPGEDLNGKGAGNSDLGFPVYSACNGKVVYAYAGTGTNGGWGKLIVIEESVPDAVQAPQTNETPKVIPTPHLEDTTPKIDEIVPIPVSVTKTSETANLVADPYKLIEDHTAELLKNLPKQNPEKTLWETIKQYFKFLIS